MNSAKDIEKRILEEFAKSGVLPGGSLSPAFMEQLNASLGRDEQENYQQAVSLLFEEGLIDLSGTSLQLTQAGWDRLQA